MNINMDMELKTKLLRTIDMYNMVEVVSSQIVAVNLIDHSGIYYLYVLFSNGDVYTYENVPLPLYETMLEADSIGKFFNKHIKNKFEVNKITEDDNTVAEVSKKLVGEDNGTRRCESCNRAKLVPYNPDDDIWLEFTENPTTVSGTECSSMEDVFFVLDEKTRDAAGFPFVGIFFAERSVDTDEVFFRFCRIPDMSYLDFMARELASIKTSIETGTSPRIRGFTGVVNEFGIGTWEAPAWRWTEIFAKHMAKD